VDSDCAQKKGLWLKEDKREKKEKGLISSGSSWCTTEEPTRGGGDYQQSSTRAYLERGVEDELFKKSWGKGEGGEKRIIAVLSPCISSSGLLYMGARPGLQVHEGKNTKIKEKDKGSNATTILRAI